MGKEIMFAKTMGNQLFKMTNKRGLSGIVTVVILVALSVALVGVVWGVVQNMVQGNLDESAACSNLFTNTGVELNNRYTCNDTTNIYFAIDVGNIEIDAILVTVEGSSITKTYNLNSSSSFDHLILHNKNPAIMPARNSGSTYNLSVSDEGLTGPYSIGVRPIIDGYTCNEISRINGIDNCVLIDGFP